MPSQDSRCESGDESISVSVRNVGGIDELEREIPLGVTVLEGQNATNRSSLLHAIMGAMGSEHVTLKSNAEEGRTELSIRGQSYTRTLRREGESTSLGGDPYLSQGDATLADLYAFLTEDNAVRRAVERGDNLYDVLMEPIDKEEIERKQRKLRRQEEQLQREISKSQKAKTELPKLEKQRNELESTIADYKSELEAIVDEIETLESSATDCNDERGINDIQQEINDARSSIADKRGRIKEKKADIETLETALAELDVPEVSPEELESEKEELESQRREVNDELARLRTWKSDVITAKGVNQDLLNRSGQIDGLLENLDIGDELPDGPLADIDTTADSASDLTSQLVDEEVTCPACGSRVSTEPLEAIADQYEALIDRVEDRISPLEAELEDLNAEIDEIDGFLQDHSKKRAEREEKERRIERLREEVEWLEAEVSELEAEIDSLEAEREEVEPDARTAELAEKNERKGRLETEIKQKEAEKSEIERELQEKQNQVQKLEDDKEELDEVRDRIDELSGKIRAVEEEIVQQFNDQITTVLDILEYENIANVRLERMVSNARNEEPTFSLTVTREEQVVYNDSIDNLSESERAVVGLVVALTGYLVHDVHEVCPVMVLDSIEMIDGNRIDELLAYFGTYQDILIAALLPGDAERVSADTAEVVRV